MIDDKTIPTVLVTLFIVCAIPAGLFFRALPPADLTTAEKELARFSSLPVAMSSPLPHAAFSGVVCPVSAASKPVSINVEKRSVSTAAPTPMPTGGKKEKARSLGSLPVVSMISYDETTKMAIIDNHVVNVGSKLDGGVIVKIEETRVLMRKAGRDIWLTIDR